MRWQWCRALSQRASAAGSVQAVGGEFNPFNRVTMAMQRSHRVAVLGAPNAGKSTLLNQLIGAKVELSYTL